MASQFQIRNKQLHHGMAATEAAQKALFGEILKQTSKSFYQIEIWKAKGERNVEKGHDEFRTESFFANINTALRSRVSKHIICLF